MESSLSFSSETDPKFKGLRKAVQRVGNAIGKAAPKAAQILGAAATVVPALQPAAVALNAGVRIGQVLRQK